ncbi:unnamed protein product [Brassica rapa]|uniref:Uncharacterized protein n=1 Tax=Brassica campestris TaxID=3711 RepID=A0A8D9D737_BRACM|nr:unnamed protein product [Brassica rapa]
MDRLLHKNGDLTKLERYHNRRPWFYRDIYRFGMRGPGAVIATSTTWRGYSIRDLVLKDFEWVIPILSGS